MKKLILSGVSDSAQMPVKKGTLQFLQDANYEAFQATILGLIGATYDASAVYVIFGCVNSGSGNVYNISAGAVFYAGEIYLVDAAPFTASGSYVAVFSLATTQYMTNADPVTFSDSTSHNIHNITKMLISPAASGSTIKDYSAKSAFNFYIPPQLILSASGATVSGTYPNLKVTVPANSNRYPAIYAGTLNIGDNLNGTGGYDYNISFADIGTDNYYVSGTIRSNSTSIRPNEDIAVTWGVRGLASNGFILRVRDLSTNWIQDISFDYILFAK